MGKNSAIEWTDHTWNPWYGCQKVSPGCKHCYAERDMLRFGKNFNAITKAKDGTFYSPDKWEDGGLIFTCSWSDFFIPEADEWRPEAWEVIKRNQRHIFQILTKRPERILDCLPEHWGRGLPNVWLGMSAANQEWLDRRAPDFLRIPAVLHFLSAEPLIGPMPHIQQYLPMAQGRRGFDWVIVGGESGVGSEWRQMQPQWVEDIWQACQQFEIPFFFKQWAGQKKPGATNARFRGQVWQEIPDANFFKPPPMDPLF